MKKRLTASEEFDILKLVLDKFLWLGFAIMAYGLWNILFNNRMTDGILAMVAGIVLLIFFPIIQHIALGFSLQLPGDFTIIELVLVYFAIVGNITAVQRFYITLRWFQKGFNRK